MEAVALHLHPEYGGECAEVMNEEWPRSKAARLHMLEKSSDKLPYSIVLLREPQTPSVAGVVIGHSRLCKVQGLSDAAFVESVVIKKCLRGKGLGRKLMDETEIHAKRLGITTLYLTTHDKQDFYAHIGYTFCKPIISLGSASTLLSEEQWNKLLGISTKDSHVAECEKRDVYKSNEKESTKHTNSEKQLLEAGENLSVSTSETSTAVIPTALPPPPPPLPPPPAPPCPPPPQLPQTAENRSNDIARMDPTKIYWMKKTLL